MISIQRWVIIISMIAGLVQTAWAAAAYPDLVMGGKDNAPVKVIEYSSLTCPHCSYFHKHALPELLKRFADTNKAQFLHRDFVMDLQGLNGVTLARCSGSHYPAFIKVLFDKQDSWAYKADFQELLVNIGKLGGVGPEQFEACLKDSHMKERIAASAVEVQKQYSIKGIPAFIINGQLYHGRPTVEELAEAIEKAYAYHKQGDATHGNPKK
jgi:protein-disulfide isomerase